jgi:hypothetical protein
MTNEADFYICIVTIIVLFLQSCNIFITSRLKGAPLFGLGIVIKISALLFPSLFNAYMIVFGDLILFSGLTIAATIEYDIMSIISSKVTLKNALLGNFHIEQYHSKLAPNQVNHTFYLWLQVVVTVVLIIVYFCLNIKFREILFFIITSPVVIVYHIVIRKRKNREK